MGNYRSIFTGKQVDDSVNIILNRGLLSILDGAVYRDNDGNFRSLISLNEGGSVEDTTPSLVTCGEKFKWNRMIPQSEKGINNGIATLDNSGKILIEQIPADNIPILDENGKVPTNKLHGAEANGVAILDENGQVLTSQLPSYVDDIIEGYKYGEIPNEHWYEDVAHTIIVTDDKGRSLDRLSNKVYLDLTDGENRIYRWGGTVYAEISPSLTLGETSSTAYYGDLGAQAYEHAVANKGIAVSEGFYKITTNSEGHIVDATNVETSDITSLGISETVSIATEPYPQGAAKIATVTIGNRNIELYAPYQGMTAENTRDHAGYLPAPTSANANKVWGTDSGGNPAWRQWSNSQTIILDKDDWDANNYQSVNIAGVTASNTIIVCPILPQSDLYGYSGIVCISQNLNMLVFRCDIVPTEDIAVNVLIIN